MGEGKYKKCFQDLSECQLFLEFPFNIFFSTSSSFQSSIPSFHFTSQNLLRTLFIFFFFDIFLFFSFFFSLFFFPILFFFFFFEFSHKPLHWNKLIKFHLETLWIRALRKKCQLKSLNGVTSNNVSRKKKKNSYMAQSR